MLPSRRGIALTLAVAVLAVLALLGTAFALLVGSERRAAAQRSHAARALLLARSGIEDLLARRGTGQDPCGPATAFAGEDWNADGALSPAEAAEEGYRPGILDRDGCPLGQALRPAFFAGAPGIPALRPVDGRRRGWSGAAGGGEYALKVAAGGFDVNGGDPRSSSGNGYNAVLQRMLGTLAEALDREDGMDDGIPADRGDGKTLIDARPVGGWPDIESILAYGASVGRAEAYRALEPYLCLDPWRDLKVIRPQGQPVLASPPRSWGEIVLSRPMHPQDPASRAPDFERLGGRVVGRAPVDLDWAIRRRPVLIALLAGLQGTFIDQSDESTLLNADTLDTLGVLASVSLDLDWAYPTDTCRVVADALMAPGPRIRTWAAWDARCDAIDPRLALLLKAAFNPNARMNKFNPNRSTWTDLDKSDLDIYSTELSLEPVQPWRVESLGRILDAKGRLLASRRLAATLPAPRVIRITTQREFACGDLGNPEVAGDEGPLRLPSDALFLGPARGAIPAWGHTLAGVPDRGLSVQLYPEPCADTGGGPRWLNPADYDGSLQRATLETRKDEDFGSGGNVSMLGRFDDGLDLDLADGSPAHQPDLRHAPWDARLLGTTAPNSLRPDGVYAESTRTPAYPSAGNVPGRRGILSFWLKRHEASGLPTYRGRPLIELTNFQATPPFDLNLCPNQFFMLGEPHKPSEAVRMFALALEIGHDVVDTLREHQYRLDRSEDLGHRWELLTLYYDFESPTANGVGRLLVNAGTAPGERVDVNTYNPSGNAAADATDITTGDLQGAHLLALGSRRGNLLYEDVASQFASGPDATFDEFLALETGQDPGKADVLASARWQDGRYYAGRAYPPPSVYGPPPDNAAPAWISAPIPVSGHLSRIAWTLYRPGAADYAELELLDASGTGYLGPDTASRSTLAPGWNPDTQSWPVGRRVTSPFRLRALFRNDAPPLPGTPLLDSPVLDDITLVFAPGSPTAWRSPTD